MGLVRLTGDRGQLVLVAAAVVAIGLAPVLFAYLQLGYHPDTERQPEIDGEEAVAYLDRSVHDAAAATAGEYDWTDREAKAEAVRAEIDGDVETLETAALEEGIARSVTHNDTAAREWAATNCESGAGKRFGACEANEGVVVQERADEAVLLAVGFDIEVVGPDGKTAVTVVIDVGAR
jgi:hypothetical protein